MHAQFEGKDIDGVKRDFGEQLDLALEELEEALKEVRSGRASPNMFD